MSRRKSERIDEHFDEVSAMDSKSIASPNITLLVLSQSDNKGPNIMTASFWMVASFNPFRYILSVLHKTYTYEIVCENPEFTLAVPTVDMIDALTLCGKVSGRDLDKLAHLELSTLPGTEIDVPILREAVGNIECSVVDAIDYQDTTFFICEVENALVKKDMLDGRILSPDAEPLAYMGSDWPTEDTHTKDRYYIKFSEDELHSYRGDKIIYSLPSRLQERFIK